MLLLSRKQQQGLRIYDAEGRYVCHVVVMGIERDRVKVGVEADARFLVLRDELVEGDGVSAPAQVGRER